MAEPLPDRRGFPLLWIAALALMVVACVVGLVLQFGAYRSELVDRARPSDERVATPLTPRAPLSPPTREDGLPAYGEYVYIEDLPEAITKVPPEYPDEARLNGVQGTVIVQALVGRDGLVKETRIVNSVPELDAAAVSAVAQWTFRPARNEDKPVAVWVAVPVKFTLR